MGIVSEPGGGGKGLVATNYRDTSGDRGWTEGQGRQSEPPEGRRRRGGAWRGPPAYGGAWDHLAGGTPRPGSCAVQRRDREGPRLRTGAVRNAEGAASRGSKRGPPLWVGIPRVSLRPTAVPLCGPLMQVKLVKDVPHYAARGVAAHHEA